MCRQDLKLLLILLEAFKDINYLKLCVIYLDKYHQNYAEYVIRELFYDQFIRKSATVTKKFYEQIFQTKSYELENCYFMHFLESQNFVNIDKQFSFKLFLRNRHDLLNEPEFRDLFGTYVEPAKLNLFDLKYHIYRTIIKLHKDDSKDAKNIFAVFQKNFLDALTKIDSDRNKMFVLIYEVLILANLIKVPLHNNAPRIFVNLMEFIISKFNFDLHFQYSRVLSLMGNIFFKFGFLKESIEVKNLALNLMVEDSKINFVEPTFMPVVTKEQHYFHILSFLIVANIETKNLGNSTTQMDKIDKWVTNDLAIKFNRFILKSLVNLQHGKQAESLKAAFEAVTAFANMNLTPFLNLMNQAILDKMTLMVIQKTSNQAEIVKVEKKSRTSITKLYEFKLEE